MIKKHGENWHGGLYCLEMVIFLGPAAGELEPKLTSIVEHFKPLNSKFTQM